MDILFVCLGNICRSPAAEGIARSLSQNDIRIGKLDSAGIGPWHAGEPPHGPMRKVALKEGFPIDDLRARQVRSTDFAEFDWILAMDRQNLRDLLTLQMIHGGKAKVRLLLEPPVNGFDEVPDPYGGTPEDFQHSFSLIRQGIEQFLAQA